MASPGPLSWPRSPHLPHPTGTSLSARLCPDVLVLSLEGTSRVRSGPRPSENLMVTQSLLQRPFPSAVTSRGAEGRDPST